MKAILVVACLSVPFILLTAWAVVDAAMKDFGTVGRKAAWVVVASIPFAGCIVYFLFGRLRGRKTA